MGLIWKILGSQTRTSAVLIAILTLLQQTGVLHLTPEQLSAFLTLLGAGGLYGLRNAIDKIGR